MRILTLTIPNTFNGAQIKTVLRKHFNMSSALMTALKTEDGIKLNGTHATVIRTVCTGDELVLRIPETTSDNIVPTPMPLDILYEDEDILAINKPAGLPTHPSIRHYTDTLANGVMHYYKETPFTFRAITRLDKDTSGIVLIAKNRFSADALSTQMRNGTIQKSYLAICCGCPASDTGLIDAPIDRDEGIIKRRIDPNGQSAKTEYRMLKHNRSYALVEAKPLTGRTHQIRLHMAHIGAPLYGDFLYGTEVENQRTMLHCASLTFRHPLSTERIMQLTAPIPSDFEDVMQTILL